MTLAAALLSIALLQPAHSVDPSKTLTLRLRNNTTPVTIAYTSYKIKASHQESQIIGEQESGFAVGDPVTLTFTFPVTPEEEPSLKLQLNKGREILSLVARDVAAYDVKRASVEQVKTTAAVVRELKLSGKGAARTGTLLITCDRVDTSKKIVDVP